MFCLWLFEKPLKCIIVRIILLEPNGPVKLSFFFKEVINVGFLIWYQFFESLTIVDAPLLLTTTTDTIADMSFKRIGARMDATESTMTALKS